MAVRSARWLIAGALAGVAALAAVPVHASAGSATAKATMRVSANVVAVGCAADRSHPACIQPVRSMSRQQLSQMTGTADSDDPRNAAEPVGGEMVVVTLTY